MYVSYDLSNMMQHMTLDPSQLLKEKTTIWLYSKIKKTYCTHQNPTLLPPPKKKKKHQPHQSPVVQVSLRPLGWFLQVSLKNHLFDWSIPRYHPSNLQGGWWVSHEIQGQVVHPQILPAWP